MTTIPPGEWQPGALGLLIAQLIGLVWPTPWPLMNRLGHQFLDHAVAATSAAIFQRGRLWLAGAPNSLAAHVNHGFFGAEIRRAWLLR